MTTLAFAFRDARLRIVARSEVLVLGGLFVLVSTLVALTWGRWGDLDSDTGYDIVAASRLLDGELPYRDFVYFYGPLAPSVVALAALAGADGFAPAAVVGLCATALILATTYILARVLLRPLGAGVATSIVAAVAFIPDNYSYVLPHTAAATLGTMLLLALLFALWRFAAGAGAGAAVCAGVALGLLPLTKPEVTAAGIAACAAFVAVRLAAGLPTRALLPRVLVPALGIPAVTYGALATQTGVHRLLFENLWPVDELNAGGNVLVEARMPLTAASFAELGGRLVIYGVGVAVLVAIAAAIERGGRIRTVSLGVVGVGAAVAVGASLANPEALRHGLQFVWGWVPAGAAIVAALLLWRSVRRSAAPPSPESQLSLVGAAALSVVAFTSYGGFFFHAPHQQMAVYYAPLAAVFLVRLHVHELARTPTAARLGLLWAAFVAAAGIGLTLKDSAAEPVVVRGAGASLAAGGVEGELYQRAVETIQRTSRPGEPILVVPLMTGLYVLTNRESPLRELSLLPGALPTPADERAAIRRLDEAGVRLVVTDRRAWPGYGHGRFGETFDRGLAAWLRREFLHAATIRSQGAEPRAIDIWRRRTA